MRQLGRFRGCYSVSDTNELILFPSLKAQRAPSGKLIMTRKYLEGTARFVAHWPGTVTVLVDLDATPTDDMDRAEAEPEKMGFKLEVCPTDQSALEARLKTAAVALGFLSGRNCSIAAACEAVGVPLVCTTEYSPKTERQIAATELTGAPLRYVRRLLWLRGEERCRRRLLPRLAGLHCSGAPTHDLYARHVPSAVLFFDNRVLAEDVISADQVDAGAADLLSDRPLRLVFGGRLITIKGADDLPKVADGLRRRGVPFEMAIVGSGPLEEQIARDIDRLGLHESVSLLPPMDFRSGWVSFLRERADLFLCTHVQGDPSSTYPEAMSCGLPIVGYDNEAFAGVLARSDGGWSVPLRRADKMAEVVARLHNDRKDILRKARNAVAFAAEHSFEKTFARRAEHLREVSRLPRP